MPFLVDYSGCGVVVAKEITMTEGKIEHWNGKRTCLEIIWCDFPSNWVKINENKTNNVNKTIGSFICYFIRLFDNFFNINKITNCLKIYKFY